MKKLSKIIQELPLISLLLGVRFYYIYIGPPCKRISPIFHAKAEVYKNIKFCVIDVDQAEDICQKVGISCMPTFIFYKNGQLDSKFEGANEEALDKKLNALSN